MTDNLKKEELLDWIDTWIKNCLKTCIEINCIEGIEQCRQACKQIKEMIQKEAERDEIEASYTDIVIDLYDQLEQKKSRVDESFVKAYVKMIKEDPHQCTRENLIGMLREAGVEVIID
ncbi:hypothetical protein LCGC14_0669470 [marine sediment metagenome]|uniref:Uncharacterized protein n=1 Tax=marine sediment metagenome TaxID=412755 RepID=A0A0F9RBI8_9ZZZZ|nr:hypothetical protein [Candidatus Aminicenantes bacterium]